MKLWLRRSFKQSLICGLVMGSQITSAILVSRTGFNRIPAATRKAKKKPATAAPAKPTTLSFNALPAIEKIYDDSEVLFKSLRWPKAPGAKKYEGNAAATEMKSLEERFTKALLQAETAINGFKASANIPSPTLQELILVPETMRKLALIHILLDSKISKAQLVEKLKAYSLSVNKTALLDSTLRIVDSAEGSSHPVKSFKRDEIADAKGKILKLSMRPAEIDGIYTAFLVSTAKNRDDLVPLLKSLITRELLRQYNMTINYLGEDDIMKELAPHASKLAEVGVSAENRVVKRESSNIAKDLAFTLEQEKNPIPFDLAKDPDLIKFVKKGFSKLGEMGAGLDAETAKMAIEMNIDGFLEGVKEDQAIGKARIAANLANAKIVQGDAAQNKKTAEDLAIASTTQALALYVEIPGKLLEAGAAKNTVTILELRDLLKKLSAKLQKSYTEYYVAWLSKAAPAKADDGEMKRLIESLQTLAKTAQVLPEGPESAKPSLLLQTKYLEIAAINPRQQTIQEDIKALAQRPNFEEARSHFKIRKISIEAAANPDSPLGVGSKSDGEIHKLVMKNRLKDLNDWKKVGEVMGFDIPGVHPSLREWIYFKAGNSASKKTKIEEEVKRALVRDAFDKHPILSMTLASADRDLMAVMVDKETSSEELVAATKKHLLQSKEQLLTDIGEVLAYQKVTEIEDFIFSSHSFKTLVESDMLDLMPLFNKEKLQRRMLSSGKFLNQKIVRNFNQNLGYFYMASIALSVAKLVSWRFGAIQKILEPAAMTLSSQLNAFSWAFLTMLSVDAVASVRYYYQSAEKREHLENFFGNSTFANALLSAADLEGAKKTESALKKSAIVSTVLNGLFLGLIIRSAVVQQKTQSVLEEFKRDEDAFDLLKLTRGNFDEAAINKALADNLAMMGEGAGQAYKEAADILLGRMARKETWARAIMDFEVGAANESLVVVPSFVKLNYRERQIVDAVVDVWKAERLRPLIEQTSRFSIRGYQ